MPEKSRLRDEWTGKLGRCLPIILGPGENQSTAIHRSGVLEWLLHTFELPADSGSSLARLCYQLSGRFDAAARRIASVPPLSALRSVSVIATMLPDTHDVDGAAVGHRRHRRVRRPAYRMIPRRYVPASVLDNHVKHAVEFTWPPSGQRWDRILLPSKLIARLAESILLAKTRGPIGFGVRAYQTVSVFPVPWS